jgi:uncharacterized iron-regulated membrane protein
VCEAVLERRLKLAFIGRSDSGRENRRVNTFRTSILSLLTAVLALLLSSPPALADNDQDRARAAVQAGKVLPLKTVLERLERDHPGQLLEVELEEDDGRWLYEIKLIEPGGRLVKLKLDAASGDVVRRIERSQRPSDRR